MSRSPKIKPSEKTRVLTGRDCSIPLLWLDSVNGYLPPSGACPGKQAKQCGSHMPERGNKVADLLPETPDHLFNFHQRRSFLQGLASPNPPAPYPACQCESLLSESPRFGLTTAMCQPFPVRTPNRIRPSASTLLLWSSHFQLFCDWVEQVHSDRYGTMFPKTLQILRIGWLSAFPLISRIRINVF